MKVSFEELVDSSFRCPQAGGRNDAGPSGIAARELAMGYATLALAVAVKDLGDIVDSKDR